MLSIDLYPVFQYFIQEFRIAGELFYIQQIDLFMQPIAEFLGQLIKPEACNPGRDQQIDIA